MRIPASPRGILGRRLIRGGGLRLGAWLLPRSPSHQASTAASLPGMHPDCSRIRDTNASCSSRCDTSSSRSDHQSYTMTALCWPLRIHINIMAARLAFFADDGRDPSSGALDRSGKGRGARPAGESLSPRRVDQGIARRATPVRAVAARRSCAHLCRLLMDVRDDESMRVASQSRWASRLAIIVAVAGYYADSKMVST
jgi:hypothetical protein